MSDESNDKKDRVKRPSASARRTASRLAAVQALYQVRITGIRPEDAVEEFVAYRSGKELDGERFVSPQKELFRDIVLGVSGRLEDVDSNVSTGLDKSQDPKRFEHLLRAILRAGIWELMEKQDTPAAIIINEYIDIAKGFYSGPEPSLVNGVLDRQAKVLRADELGNRQETPRRTP